MIDRRATERALVKGIKGALTAYNCELIRSNQTAPAPPYPYGSYTVTGDNPKVFWGYDGTKHMREVQQTWSFTFQSEDDQQAYECACLAAEWLSLHGHVYLYDNNIAVASVGNVANRDSFITIEYEHRYGFDVVLNLMNVVEDKTEEFIEEVTYE